MPYTLMLAIADIICIVAGGLLLLLSPTIKNPLGRYITGILGLILIRLILMLMLGN